MRASLLLTSIVFGIAPLVSAAGHAGAQKYGHKFPVPPNFTNKTPIHKRQGSANSCVVPAGVVTSKPYDFGTCKDNSTCQRGPYKRPTVPWSDGENPLLDAIINNGKGFCYEVTGCCGATPFEMDPTDALNFCEFLVSKYPGGSALPVVAGCLITENGGPMFHCDTYINAGQSIPDNSAFLPETKFVCPGPYPGWGGNNPERRTGGR